MGIDQVHIDLTRFFKSIFDCILGDFIEDHTVGIIFIQVENMGQMPRNRFSFTVRVTREKNFISFFSFFFQVIDKRAFSSDIDILRFIIIFNIDGHTGFLQITDMPDTG
ncbi:Uncharacterised protein [Streptococcus pneumoniae]|nr:Uncharacterised protein [Streptococcus pneumoniae]